MFQEVITNLPTYNVDRGRYLPQYKSGCQQRRRQQYQQGRQRSTIQLLPFSGIPYSRTKYGLGRPQG